MSRLTSSKRKSLPKSDFAGPGRSYPDEDKNHARNALARVSEFGSPAEKAEVRAKVHRKFPEIGKSHLGGRAHNELHERGHHESHAKKNAKAHMDHDEFEALGKR